MDLLDRLLEHDAWTTHKLLLCCQNMADEQLDRKFDISHRTVRATFLHIIRNMEVWTELMAGRTVTEALGPHPEDSSISGLIKRLNSAASGLAGVAHEIAERDGWDEEWVDKVDDPPTKKTFGGSIGHVITHSMHHRAQLIYMLRRLGITDLPEGDMLSWEKEERKRADGTKRI